MSLSPAPASASPGRTFEFPCNERVRMLLRIECLGRRLRSLSALSGRPSHEATLVAFFEFLDLLGSRSDVKTELLQELERQRARMQAFANNPAINAARLKDSLDELERHIAHADSTPMRLGPHIPEHEFLAMLRSRAGVPGGLCAFDHTAYQLWLSRPDEQRADMLHSWIAPWQGFLDSVGLALGFLRDSAEPTSVVAVGGGYEASPQGRSVRLIRVEITDPRELGCEVSANKYLVAVRFRLLANNLNYTAVTDDLPFSLTLCDF